MMRAILLCLALASCASAPQSRAIREDAVTRSVVEREIEQAFKRSEFSQAERRAFTLSVIAHSADLITTATMGPKCVETNPFLPARPALWQLIAVKAIVIGFERWLYSRPGTDAQLYGYTSAVLHAGVAIHNSRVDCGG